MVHDAPSDRRSCGFNVFRQIMLNGPDNLSGMLAKQTNDVLAEIGQIP